jgi:hypothetical protein
MSLDIMDNLLEFADIAYRYVVGIDLGTTNSALAYVDLTADDSASRQVRFFEIPQLTAPNELNWRPVLPSFLYLPGPYELPAGSTSLPWDLKRDYAVGEFAREQGALVPGRLVASAKSWLCHGGIDRTAAILPWAVGPDVNKVSPVEASARYLQHLREAWNQGIAKGREGYRLEEQLVILTVPASFDEVARELTVTAARDAGLPRVILAEEPLAAFYAWLSKHEADWEGRMDEGQVILVCDVGGGTSDFTIIAVRRGERGLRFDRLAVGEHLMLGGDNMDLSLARLIEAQVVGTPGQLDSRRWHQLWHQCRKAKEMLLGQAEGEEYPSRDRPDTVTVTIMGSGSKLIADTLKGTLSRELVQERILDGFFPPAGLGDTPQISRRTGLTEWGLPYVQDPAVTRHLAAFWQRYRTLLENETGRTSLYPDFILFNGGALTPASVRAQILEVVGSWFQHEAGTDWVPVELENPHPELAVAIGAAYYGLVRLGAGVRVGAGSPRAYYVEVAPTAASEALADEFKAVCIVPRGTEEGFEAKLQQLPFEVLANQPATFRLFTSFTRLGDRLGDLVSLSNHEISHLPPIRTVLRYGKKGTAQRLPVQLAIRLTEVGTLELWCQSVQSGHRWQLQFDVRDQGSHPEATFAAAGETFDAMVIERAQKSVQNAFCLETTGIKNLPEKLTRDLVAIFELGKDKWPTSLIRKLADVLYECRQGRALTFHHESRWLNLLGFCMRPGFGAPLDDWRMKAIWKIYPLGLQFQRQSQCRSEWWIFWRRVAGGLTSGQQWHIYQNLLPVLQAVDKKKKKPPTKSPLSRSDQEEVEIWMALANFEYLPAATKIELGRHLLEKIRKGRSRPQELWALGRLGARIPFHGPLDQVVPSEEASRWVHDLLSLNLEASDFLARSLVHLARRSGDRARDLSPRDIDHLSEWLQQTHQAERYLELLTDPEAVLFSQEKAWIFGEGLPTGLIVSGSGA